MAVSLGGREWTFSGVCFNALPSHILFNVGYWLMQVGTPEFGTEQENQPDETIHSAKEKLHFQLRLLE